MKLPFQEAWAADTEFAFEGGSPGGRPLPHTFVAVEMNTGRVIRLHGDDLRAREDWPFDVHRKDVVVVAYFASADIGAAMALGWSVPGRIIDLYAEHSLLINVEPKPVQRVRRNLLEACRAHGVDIDAVYRTDANSFKVDTRELALRGEPFTPEESAILVRYCEADVRAVVELVERFPQLDCIEHALIRGQYGAAVAGMERVGIPIDAALWDRLAHRWNDIRGARIRRFEKETRAGIFDQLGHFRSVRFEEFLSRLRIPWRYHASGIIDLQDETFVEMAERFPELGPVHKVRRDLAKLNLVAGLQVGPDGRNRCLLSPFASKTGRNQPSNKCYLFGMSRAFRRLAKPDPGFVFGQVDWSGQEIGIAAALSGDVALADAYRDDDPYISFARMVGAVPPEATKTTHPEVRSTYKTTMLGVGYGQGRIGLSRRLGVSETVANSLLDQHRTAFRRFWEWSDAVVRQGFLDLELKTPLGWKLRVHHGANPRTLRNFPIQGCGADMLSLASIYASRRGLALCGPVHDALLFEAPLSDLDQHIDALEDSMAQASRELLSGFELRSDVKVARYPERYQPGVGAELWTLVMNLLEEVEGS